MKSALQRPFWNKITNEIRAGLTILVLSLAIHPVWAAESSVTGADGASGNFPKLKVITEQAEQGDARAQFKLGDYYYAQGQFQEAVRWYGQSARQGNAVAQTALANCYATGRGVKRNPAEAAKWLRMATHQKALPPQITQKQVLAKKSSPPADKKKEVTQISSVTSSSTETPTQPDLAPEFPSVYPPIVDRILTLQAPEPRIQDSHLVIQFVR